MKVLLINATMRKETTYNIAQMAIKHLNTEEIKEIFLPKDLPKFCLGCGQCFMKGEEYCPHYEYTKRILDLLEWADIYIFASPVYVYHTTGQLKAFLDHFGFMWMVHRPRAFMFNKKALVISTAAGAGMKSTNKDIKDSLDFWGVGKTYTYGKASNAINYKEVKEIKKIMFDKDMKKYSKKLSKNRRKPNFKVRFLFSIIKIMQKRFPLNKIDVEYWKDQNFFVKKPY